ncbi:MAG: hypothetical protein DRI36_03455 [Caldiserica bacterium]|nr:MAG: hypothetical protein DRI36_03455 [Caldisericota bacterium]
MFFILDKILLMIRLTKKQRENLGRVFLDLSKYIFTALVIGQFIALEKFEVSIFIGGSIAFVVFLIIGLAADKGEK